MTRSEGTLKIGGKAVQLFTGGQGPPLLYPHRAGTYWWMPVDDLLGAQHRGYAPAHPGFGASEGLEDIESMEDLVFHAVDVLDALGLERVDVVGWSLAGWLAAELALRHPGRVHRLVLGDAAGTRVPGVVREPGGQHAQRDGDEEHGAVREGGHAGDPRRIPMIVAAHA